MTPFARRSASNPVRPAALQGIEQLPKRFQVMPADVERIKTYIREHT